MPSYQIRYEAPEVSFYSVPPTNGGNSGSGQTVVGGVVFTWTDAESGFTGTSWWGTEIENGPTYIGGFRSDEEVRQHLSTPGASLSEAFVAWQEYIDGLPVWDQGGVVSDFGRALAAQGGGLGRSCMVEA